MWLNRDADVVEPDYYKEKVSVTNAYAGTVTQCRLNDSKQKGSKSVSLFIEVTTTDDEVATEFLTITGKDGNTFYINKKDGSKRQHIGLGTANTLFLLTLGKEIFDIEPTNIEYEAYDKENEEMKTVSGQGFPEMIGKEIGIAVQVTKEGEGADIKFGTEIQHFFNPVTGTYWNESDKGAGYTRKIDKWIKKAPEYKVIEAYAPKRSFGGDKKSDTNAGESKGWGR